MERLTFEGNFCDIAQCRELPCKYDGNCTQKEVWERLKAYEDAGLSPQACAEAREIEETLSGCDYSISRMVELIVRCKDCKYYRNHPNGLCYLHTEPKENERGYSGEAVCVEPDDFCSYGERREE